MGALFQNSNSRKQRTLVCLKSVWRKERLIILIIFGVILGISIGIGINRTVQNLEEPIKSTTLTLLGFPGELLMRMLKMLIQPLIVCSLIVGLASLGHQATGRIGRRTIIYYLGTTVIAIFIGLILVFIIQPGKKASLNYTKLEEIKEADPLDSFLDFLRNLFPDNIVQAAIQRVRTTHRSLQIPVETIYVNMTDMNASQVHAIKKKFTLITKPSATGTNRTYYIVYKTVDIAGPLEYAWGSNNLGLVLIATSIGIIAGRLGSKVSIFIKFVSDFNDIVMQLIVVVMWFAPFGIWSLLTVSFARMANISDTFASIGMLMFTVVFGMAIQSLIIYPSIYFFIVRKNPFVYMKGITKSLVTAFGTSSSAATLPVTLHCVENENGVDKKVSRFMLPIGVTINMDGSALYNAVTTIFLAQVYNFSLSFGKCLAISFAAVMASIGAAGVPTVAPVAILIVLQAAGIPVELISLVYAVDWLLDRFQTVLNVCGDSFGAGIVEHLSKEDLKADIVKVSDSQSEGSQSDDNEAEDTV